jgi:(p)ppGpp synthase/HD superfamily hydrolase
MYTRTDINKFLRTYKSTGDMKRTASDFAEFAHTGQKDKAGNTLFSHIQRVVDILKGDQRDDSIITIGYLHDILDNGGFTQGDLSMFFPENVWEAVVHLSHNKTSCREEYFAQIMESRPAILVKIADLSDNRAIIMNDHPTDKEYWKRVKYNREIDTLTSGLAKFSDCFSSEKDASSFCEESD